MAITLFNITQPPLGGITSFVTRGDPSLKLDDIIYLEGYGRYQIVAAPSDDPVEGTYEAQLLARFPNAPSVIPAGTHVLTQTESLRHVVKGYTATTFLSFAETPYQSMVVTGNLTLAAQRHAPGRGITIRLINNNSVAKTLSFPASWTFLGIKPTVLLGSKTGILSITCFQGSTGDEATASDADVVAVWSSQL